MVPTKIFHLITIYLCLSFSANADERIIWLSDVSSIVDNFYSQKRSTLGIETTRNILKKLNFNNIEIKIADLSKITKLMVDKSSVTYCVADRIKNPKREKYQLFSKPTYLYPNIKLYYGGSKQNFPQDSLNKEGYLISLNSLFNNDSDLVLTVEKNRSYGRFLDNQIALIPKKNINVHSLKGSNTAMIALFLRKRVKHALIFPTDFNNKINHFKKNNNVLKALDIVGNPSYIFSRIACSKTPLGQQVINAVNHILDEQYLSNDFYDMHIKFLPKNYHSQFKKDITKLTNGNRLF